MIAMIFLTIQCFDSKFYIEDVLAVNVFKFFFILILVCVLTLNAFVRDSGPFVIYL